MEAFLRDLHATLTASGGVHDGDDSALDLEVVLAEEVVTYLSAAAEESMPLEDFLEVLSGFCPELDADNAATPEVHELYVKLQHGDASDDSDVATNDRGSSKGDEPVQEGPSSASAASEYRVTDFKSILSSENGKNKSATCYEDKDGDNNSSSENNSDDDDDDDDDDDGEDEESNKPMPPSPEETIKLEQVMVVCPPNADANAVLHTMRKLCNNDPETTAMFILDRGIDQVHAIFKRDFEDKEALAAQQAELDAKEQQRVKKSIMEKFDEFAVTDSSKSKSAAAIARDNRKAARRAKKKEQDAKTGSGIRYLDGQIVSRKGGRYMIIDDTKEWDGGSRGRVKTKGKRGTGWA